MLKVRGLIAVLVWVLSASVLAGERFITVASTTSTRDSGLFDAILPVFEGQYGVQVRIVAQGTGKAITLAKRGDADVLLVHAKAAEEKFVTEGYGVERFDVMYNDFVLIGPKADPAAVSDAANIQAALQNLAQGKGVFYSRGDDSGTHKKERALWRQAAVETAQASWYRETGAGMGATLNTASAAGGYVLSDRATWLKFANKGELTILLDGDAQLFNQYGVILVNPTKHAHVKAEDGQAFIDWLRAAPTQQLIADYRIAGQQGFFPNAR